MNNSGNSLMHVFHSVIAVNPNLLLRQISRSNVNNKILASGLRRNDRQLQHFIAGLVAIGYWRYAIDLFNCNLVIGNSK
jgi:hypothetical protein